jgi:hypothetical protein
MNNIFKIGFLVGVLSCCFSSDARVGTQHFKIENNKGVLNMYVNESAENGDLPPYYLLFWGSVMRESGFLEKLRFNGNFIKSSETRDNNGLTVVDRRFDKGQDDLESLIIALFPSNLGTGLEATWRSQDIADSLSIYCSHSGKFQSLE